MTRPTPPAPDQLHQIGPYTAKRLIGHGAMGLVYAVRRDGDATQYALKMLVIDQLNEERELAIERFTREVRAVTSLHHPSIVRVYDGGRAEIDGIGEVLYYVMEIIEGETLHRALNHGPFFSEETAAIGVRVADALHFAHGFGIVHRDIKPANIFYTPDQRVVITDFGVCRLTDLEAVTDDGALVGTIPFLAPEQLLEEPIDSRADIFAAGALLYTLLTRRYLRPPNSVRGLLDAVAEGRDVAQVLALKERFDPRLIDVIARAVARDPAERYQRAKELVDALWPLAGDLPQPGGRRTAAPRAGKEIPQVEATLLVGEGTPMEPTQGRVALRRSQSPSGEHAIAPTRRRQEPPRLPHFGPPAEISERRSIEVSEARRAVAIRAESEPPIKMSEILRRHEQESAAAQPTGDDGLAEQEQDPQPPGMQGANSGKVRLHLPREATSKKVSRIAAVLNHTWVRVALLLVVLLALGWGGREFLLARSVTVRVETIPPGGTVSVEGKEVGTSPCEISVPRGAGQLEVEIRAPLRESFRQTVTLSLFGEVEPLVVAMPYLRGRLKVTTKPPGATVSIDGAPVCETPCDYRKLVARERRWVSISKEGCERWRMALEVEPGEEITRNIELRPLRLSSLSLLQVITRERSTFHLDGEEVTDALDRRELLVPAGPHLLSVQTSERSREIVLDMPRAGARRLDLRHRPQTPRRPRLLRSRALSELRQPDRIAATVDDSVDYAIHRMAQGDPAEAQKYLSQALSLVQDDSRVHRSLVVLMAQKKKGRRAREHAQSLLSLSQPSSEVELLRRTLTNEGHPEVCRGPR